MLTLILSWCHKALANIPWDENKTSRASFCALKERKHVENPTETLGTRASYLRLLEMNTYRPKVVR